MILSRGTDVHDNHSFHYSSMLARMWIGGSIISSDASITHIRESKNHLIIRSQSPTDHLRLSSSSHSSMISLYSYNRIIPVNQIKAKANQQSKNKKKENKASNFRLTATDLINRFLLFCSPVDVLDGPTNVNVNIFLRSISKIDDYNMVSAIYK